MVIWASLTTVPLLLESKIEERESFFEIERGRDALEGESELNHREGDFGLDSHDDGFAATEPRRVGEVPERSDGEGIHDIERGHVDDDALGAKRSDPRHQRL